MAMNLAPNRSRHTGETWHDQWNRVQRWFRRLSELEGKHLVSGNQDFTYVFLPEYAIEEVDVAYAFFMSCFHLKDWIVGSTDIAAETVESHIRSCKSLSRCADICNGVKHFELDRARADMDWRRARGYSPSGDVSLPFVFIQLSLLNIFSSISIL